MSRILFTFLFLSIVLSFTGCGASSSDPFTVKKTETGEVSFQETVAPLLKTHCGNCHYGQKPAGGLNVLSYETLMAGGSRGQAIIPKDPDASLIIGAVEKTAEPNMPPKFFRSLGQDRIDILRQWIREGAKNN